MLNFQASDFIGKSSKETAARLQALFVPVMLERLPFALEQGLLIFYGSAARGRMIAGSDIDALLFLPAQALLSRKKDLQKASAEFWHAYSIDFSFSYSEETLFSEATWNNDFLLHALSEAAALYDPKNIFPGRVQHLSSYPTEVLKEKIIFTGWELMKILARLDRRLAYKDTLSIIPMRAKLVKLNLILLCLRHNYFFDAHNLYLMAKQKEGLKPYRELVEQCTASIGTDLCDELLEKLTLSVFKEIAQAGLLPPNFYGQWRQWERPLRYSISDEWQ